MLRVYIRKRERAFCNGKQLFKGFTPGETEQYKVLFDKMCENAAEGLAETERMN
jgi:hypothetical protein